MVAFAATGDFTVRELQARDVPALRALFAQWVPEHWSSSGLEYAQVCAHQFRVFVQRVKGREELAGIAEYQLIMDEGHLLGIAIVPRLQRRGLGMQLLEAVLAQMRAQGCKRCLLEVRRSNVAGQALYQRAQFALDGIRKDYYPTLASEKPASEKPAGEKAAVQSREDALLYSRTL